tara:strand:+ start:10283 stop:11464 length:1182 start_codon:yes stop_codon:yes gene_type:complete
MSESKLSEARGKWTYPNQIYFGCGSLNNIANLTINTKIKRPLLVADPGLPEQIISRTFNYLKQEIPETGLFTDITENPSDKSVTSGLEVFRSDDHDGVVTIGGGSAIDVGKAIAFMDGESRPIFDFEDRFDWWERAERSQRRPVIAIPTTAGTGSEVGRASVITDSRDGHKKLIFHPDMLPKMSILDAELTLALPAELTAATGMDALVHNLESYIALGCHPIAEGVALEGLRLASCHLKNAVENGSDLESRCGMLFSSTMGAIAFQKGLGAVHALAHPVGSLFQSHHGLTNAVLLPYVLAYNFPLVQDKLATLARYLDLQGNTPDSFLEWIIGLRASLNIPNTLSALGPNESDINKLAKLAINDQATTTNPRPLNENEISDIYKNAISGHINI